MMSDATDQQRADGGDAAADDASTGLPGLHSWPLVYGFVLAMFVVWVLLLTWLTLGSGGKVL